MVIGTLQMVTRTRRNFPFPYTVLLIVTKVYTQKVMIHFHCANAEIIRIEVVVLLVSVSIFTDLLTENCIVVFL